MTKVQTARFGRRIKASAGYIHLGRSQLVELGGFGYSTLFSLNGVLYIFQAPHTFCDPGSVVSLLFFKPDQVRGRGFQVCFALVPSGPGPRTKSCEVTKASPKIINESNLLHHLSVLAAKTSRFADIPDLCMGLGLELLLSLASRGCGLGKGRPDCGQQRCV